jgi:HD-like signal output (HDOD) protein
VTADVASILLTGHEQLHARAGAAARVLQVVDDPDAGAQEVARALGQDAVLAARVLRLANSPYYGLGGRVSTLPFAVSLIGFQVVRSLTVIAAAGLDGPDGSPPGFWRAAAVCATAAERIAPVLEADPGDSFSLGLLHIFGAALLHQHAPLERLCLPEPDDAGELTSAEVVGYGISHDELGARMLAKWHFPDRISALIARHHEPLLPGASPLERDLHVARLLTHQLLVGRTRGSDEEDVLRISEARILPDELPPLLVRIEDRSLALLDGLHPRR